MCTETYKNQPTDFPFIKLNKLFCYEQFGFSFHTICDSFNTISWLLIRH